MKLEDFWDDETTVEKLPRARLIDDMAVRFPRLPFTARDVAVWRGIGQHQARNLLHAEVARGRLTRIARGVYQNPVPKLPRRLRMPLAKREVIEGALRAGLPKRVIARHFRISRSTMWRIARQVRA